MEFPFEHFSERAKAWVYQSDRKFSDTEVEWINDQLPLFTSTWKAHGSQLNAAGSVVKNHFVCLAVEEDEASASGCSIDSSVRFIKSLEKELNCSFFNRLKMLIEENGELKYVAFSSLNEITPSFVFNNSIQTVGELRKKWRVPLSEYLAK